MFLNSGKTYSYLVSGLNWGNTSVNSFVSVGDVSNPPYSGTYNLPNGSNPITSGIDGVINYTYQISKYEITNNEYCLFLNSVDPFGDNINSLYLDYNIPGIRLVAKTIATNKRVAGDRYYVIDNMGNKPVSYLNYFQCARFCNWLHNGAKRYDISDPSATAPQNTGVYNVGTLATSSNTGISSPSPTGTASFRIPLINEWFKAAYYIGSGQYSQYATQSNSAPEGVGANSVGDGFIIKNNNTTKISSDILTSNSSVDIRTSLLKCDILNNQNNLLVTNRTSNISNDVLCCNIKNTIVRNNFLNLDILNSNNKLFNNITNLQIDVLSNKPVVAQPAKNNITTLNLDVFNTKKNDVTNVITSFNLDIFNSQKNNLYNDIDFLASDILTSSKTYCIPECTGCSQCIDGFCVDICSDCQDCVDGICVDRCSGCETCVSGVCVDNCTNPSLCRQCVSGTCVDYCYNPVTEVYDYCCSGVCQSSPCNTVVGSGCSSDNGCCTYTISISVDSAGQPLCENQDLTDFLYDSSTNTIQKTFSLPNPSGLNCYDIQEYIDIYSPYLSDLNCYVGETVSIGSCCNGSCYPTCVSCTVDSNCCVLKAVLLAYDNFDGEVECGYNVKGWRYDSNYGLYGGYVKYFIEPKGSYSSCTQIPKFQDLLNNMSYLSCANMSTILPGYCVNGKCSPTVIGSPP